MGTAFVITDSWKGSIRRYEHDNGVLRKTHKADVEPGEPLPITFGVELVQSWIKHAPGEFYCGPLAPVPGGDRPGGAPAAIAA